jgi:ABC-type uncharacterized transport system permease subunit
MHTGINTICFAASYGIALLLEVSQLWVTIRYRRLLEIVAASAGLVAHTWYLARRVAEQPAAPLASQQDWFLLAAWILAVVYLAARFYYPNRSLGLFLLPGVEGLVGASVLASQEPLVSVEAPRVWGIVHGVFLLLGTVAVLVGFLAGLMYLQQSRRLKAKRTAQSDFRLPSLEWLQRANSHALATATVMMCGGFLTGVITRLAQGGHIDRFSWTDPVVLSLAAMTVWLLAAEAFRLLYPAARQGRKVAFLTVAAFVFLLLVFAAVMWGDRFHQQRVAQDSNNQISVSSPIPRGGDS